MNRLLPEHHQEWGRRTGASTVIALRAIADAIASPGKRIVLADHYFLGQRRADRHLAVMVRHYIDSLGLKFMKVEESRPADRAQNRDASFIVVSEHIHG